MMNKHPSEAELQKFALGESIVDKEVTNHIALCEQCQVQVANYRMMFTAAKQQEKPSFDFDLSQLVLAQIQPPKTKCSWDRLFGYAVAVVVAAVLGAAGYWFGSSFSELFKGVSSSFVSLISIASIIFLAFQCIEMYKTYRKKISVLDII